MSITKERFFNEFKKDQATYDEIHENILDGVKMCIRDRYETYPLL